MSHTYKQAVPNEDQESKLALESKWKGTTDNLAHEIGVKNDGTCTYEAKSDYLQVGLTRYLITFNFIFIEVIQCKGSSITLQLNFLCYPIR